MLLWEVNRKLPGWFSACEAWLLTYHSAIMNPFLLTYEAIFWFGSLLHRIRSVGGKIVFLTANHHHCRTLTVSHPLFRWMWRSGLVEFGMSIGENGSYHVHLKKSQGTNRSWVHFHLQKCGKQNKLFHSTVGWRQSRWPWQMFEDLASFATRPPGGMVGSHLNHLPVISRWCDSLGDAALCEIGWLVHQKVDDEMWEEKKVWEGTSTTRGCGTGNVWERLWNLKHIWKNMKNIIYWFFEEKFGQGEISTFWSFWYASF